MKSQTTVSITSTDLARHLATYIDKVRFSGRSINITKGANIVAKISPASKAGIPIENLCVFLQNLPKLDDEAKSMAKDIKTNRNHAKLPENPWD